ncbi:NifB/NifX family molybdenum-iron cluster-binding protein [Candidatus Bathyarchaeota archaeon]|nr:NifB/NifX family molybdenum-iron cluster-binding protein [Candidatus Bathyarchaeota archaeon]
MKIAVSSTGGNLESAVDPRFGRCTTFIVVDTETMEAEAVSNTSIGAAHGAGIGAAQSVARLGVKAVVTGHVGPNAHMALSGAGVEVYTGAQGTVKNAVEMFKGGRLSKAGSPTVGGHFGQGGRGGGMGRRTQV